MNLIAQLEESCRKEPRLIALPESEDPRVLKATAKLAKSGCVRAVVLFGERSQIRQNFTQAGLNFDEVHDRLLIADEHFQGLSAETIAHYREHLQSRGKSIDAEQLKRQSENRLLLAGELLYQGKVDAVVAGAESTTAEVIRAAIGSVGLAPGCRTVSGSFILTRPNDARQLPSALMFADAGVVPEPTAAQLIDIASSTVQTWNEVMASLYGTPKLAFLSFSTKGSATHAASVKMAAAAEEFQKRFPDIAADGEMQFDAAIIPDIAARKCPQSAVAGQANILIFPDLNSGNIGYKIAQRLGGYSAYGPILQGLKQAYCDLSRGASVDDIYAAALINLLRART